MWPELKLKPMTWPSDQDFVSGNPIPRPETWDRPGLLMFFNLECPGCVSRGIPLIKRMYSDHSDQLHFLAVHTSFGHRHFERQEVVPTLLRFIHEFAKLPFPVALDLEGQMAQQWQALGTPHWLVFGPKGELVRSIYGSQDNAQNRLGYVLEELTLKESKGAGEQGSKRAKD